MSGTALVGILLVATPPSALEDALVGLVDAWPQFLIGVWQFAWDLLGLWAVLLVLAAAMRGGARCGPWARRRGAVDSLVRRPRPRSRKRDVMQVHLVDGTYELFRQYLAPRPGHADGDGVEVGAVRAVVGSILQLLEGGATHVGVATDHVVESFRNDLWADYKTGEGLPAELLDQFPMLEDALAALGVTVWPMVELEADDALASAAAVARDDPRVERVFICTPDKDLGQCVGGKVVQLDRRKEVVLDAAGVQEKFGVPPESIPDWLALVGDSADGFPGLPGFGAKSAAALLRRYGHVEDIPDDGRTWDVPGLRGADRLAATLKTGRAVVNLFKVLATLRTDADVGTVDDWEWRRPRPELAEWCDRFGSRRLLDRAEALSAARA